MKKILNDPVDYVDEMLDGLCAAHPEYYAQPTPRVIARAGGAIDGKVGIVTGGGSGHLPIFTGYVGPGLLDAAAIGDVFSSPTAEQMAAAMGHAHGGAGILRLYGNYGGDVMNFDISTGYLAKCCMRKISKALMPSYEEALKCIRNATIVGSGAEKSKN